MVRNPSFSSRTGIDQNYTAPLALRAAKQAISRSEDLPLETGKAPLRQDDNSFSLASRARFRTRVV